MLLHGFIYKNICYANITGQVVFCFMRKEKARLAGAPAEEQQQ